MVGMEREVIEMVADISSSKMYVHLRKVDNNDVNNNNYVERDKIKLFPITVGVCTRIFCSEPYYHMIFNIKATNMQLQNKFERDKLHMGYLFCYKKIQYFYHYSKLVRVVFQ